MRKTLFLFLLTCVLVSLIGKSESPAQTPLQKEYLALDAQILKLPEPVDPSTVFDFSLQRDVNHELGIK